MADLESLRLKIRPLLHFSAPMDALAVYYAFYHDDRRTRLYVHEREDGRADGFVAVCQTGQRLFTPTVVLRTPDVRVAGLLLREALLPYRPYYVVTTPDLRDVVADVVTVEEFALHHIYRLNLFRIPFSINILVRVEMGAGRWPRFVIRSAGEVAAEAGINWASPHFAELFVRTAPASRGQGWGQAVLLACTTWVVLSGRQPLYVVRRGNMAGIALAESVGFVDTGARELAGEGVARGDELPHLNGPSP